MNKKYAGIDYSITSPSIVIFNNNYPITFSDCSVYSLTSHKITDQGNLFFTPQQKFNDDIRRFDFISDWALDVLTGADSIALEGYSMGSKGKVFNIAENTAFLKYKLFKAKQEYELVPPTVLKKYATGKGNADKSLMYDAFTKTTGILLKEIIQPNRLLGNPTTDIVDAYFLCRMLVI